MKKPTNKNISNKTLLKKIEEIQCELRNFSYELSDSEYLKLGTETLFEIYDHPETVDEAIKSVLIDRFREDTINKYKLSLICDKLFNLYYKD